MFGQFLLSVRIGIGAYKEVLLERRVVVTGIGLVTPLGIGVEETWSALIAGKSGVGEITRFDTTDYATKIAAEVKGFNAEDFMPKKDAKRMETFIAYAVAATRMAIDDSGLKIDSSNGHRVDGLLVGGASLEAGSFLPIVKYDKGK